MRLLVALGLLLVAETALAQGERQIDSCYPESTVAGEVVLLTLSGNFPTGGLIVEFYPQQLEVLATEQLDQNTVAVQVSIPYDAPVGKYNVLAYNLEGEEALGTALLTVSRRTRAPRISKAEPLEIDSSMLDFGLKMQADLVDEAALSQMSVKWMANGQEITGIESEFLRGGIRQLLLNVRGEMPPGEVIGRIYFDSNPIFLVRLLRTGANWSLIGHRPAQVINDSPGCELVFFGKGLTPLALGGVRVEVASLKGEEVATAALEWIDSVRARVSLTPIPDPGDYSLSVMREGSVMYQGPFKVLSQGEADAQASSRPQGARGGSVTRPTAEEQPRPQSAAGASRSLPDWESAIAVESDEPPNKADEAGASEQVSVQPRLDLVCDTSVIPHEAKLLRVKFSGKALESIEVEGLNAKLALEAEEAELVFLGKRSEGLVLIFNAPAQGWQAGATYMLKLSLGDPVALVHVEPLLAD